MKKTKLFWVITLFILAGCNLPSRTATPKPVEMISPTGTVTEITPAPLVTFTAVPTEEAPLAVWVDPAVPAGITDLILMPDGAFFTADEAAADVQLSLTQSGPIERVYAVVAPFSTITDSVTLEDLQSTWRGESSGYFAGRAIWMTEETARLLTAAWRDPGENAVALAPIEDLIGQAWNTQPAWAVVPFDTLSPRWKVLSVDGQNPLDRSMDINTYPLTLRFGLTGSPEKMAKFGYRTDLSLTNRDMNQMSTVAMTGVTALTRTVGLYMDLNGVIFPVENVIGLLSSADITHISNEVSFMEGCKAGEMPVSTMKFCSNPEYIEALSLIGADVIELTGNHLNDYGRSAFVYTLDRYDQMGLRYFGGGRTKQDAQKPLLMEDHGNKVAFIGCNYAGPYNDWATETLAGSATCDIPWIKEQIANLKSQGYLVIMTFQYYESYQVKPGLSQKTTFEEMSDAGADIVNGSQAHLPQTYEIRNNRLIHFGLGNLFFDQMDVPVVGTRRLFIDLHTFYQGRYISTQVKTLYFEDWGRPRFMTEDERSAFLEEIFSKSVW